MVEATPTGKALRSAWGLMTAFTILGSVFPLPLASQEPNGSASSGAQVPDAYERGMELRRTGAWEQALELWEEASDFFTAPSDPRIGFSFMEVAVEHADQERYGLASQMYLWGLSDTEYEPHLRQGVEEELERILPILEEDEAQSWSALRDSATDRIVRELKRFWIEKDPTPASPMNERLIEHWERILHARERFRYSEDSPYRTDDRGIIYVKFGPAERIKSGMLGAGEMELKIRIPGDALAREAIRRYDTTPQFEVWVYDELNPKGFTFFLFGNEDGRGRFRLVDGVRDLIPAESRSQSSARYTPGGVPAAYYLELFYYETLSDVGGHFGRRFAELDELWNLYTARRNPAGGYLASPSENTLQAYSYRYDMRDRNDPETPAVVPFLSAYEGVARDEMVVQTVRTLRDNEPRLFIMAISASKLDVEDRSGLRRQRLLAPGSAVQHTLIVRDYLLREVGRLTERATSATGDVSTFFLRHVALPMHLTVTAETILETDSLPRQGEVPGQEAEPSYPSQTHIEPEEPLSTDPDRLEISDLTTGVRLPETIDGSSLPFPLLPARRIWQWDPLRVYMEVYHLEEDANGARRFRGDFRVLALRDDGSIDESKRPVTLSVDLQTEGPMFAAPFDIALRDQELGHYRVEVVVTDLISGKTLSRWAPFEIIG